MNMDINSEQSWDEQDKIRQQFDYGPYPRIPLERSPKEDYSSLFEHSLVTAHYLRHRRVVSTKNKAILDAGCGSGYKTLILAEANPEAKIVGVDLSERSVELARKRLDFHGFQNVEFHCLRLEDLPQLGLKFDYINCDEVLYLLPDPAAGLQRMKLVLKPDGIIRANLHSAYQRTHFFRAQELFKFVGLMNANPEEFEEEVVVETMKSLKDKTRLKVETWGRLAKGKLEPEKMKEYLAMNFLFIGDRGYTIPQLFSFLEQANLEFVSMVNWRHWEVTDLFQDPDNLPLFWGMCLSQASIQERLHLYELLHPVNRLIDFWCTHPGTAAISVDEWDEATWQTAVVHLHPHLRSETFKETLIDCIRANQSFEISKPIQLPTLAPVFLEATLAACLVPLWDSPQPIQTIAKRYQQVRPVDPVTLELITEAMAFAAVKDLLNRLDAFLYVLLESP